MLNSILVFILLLVAAFQCMAQTCTVRGHVADLHSGERLVGAAVRNAGNLQNGTITDENGTFSLAAATSDTLLVTYMGYEDEKIFVASLVSCEVVVRLSPIMKSIDAVEIKAERIIAEEFTIRKLKKLDIYTNPSAKADPILAVNAMPSATTTDESANISLRGGSPAETGIFFNGVPINDAVRYSQMNGIGTFSIFNTALINTVQVYPGNPPLEYGNSTSGLIALQTDENIPAQSVSTLSLTMASVGFYHSRKLGEHASLTCFSNHQPSALIGKINARAMENLKGFSSTDLGMHYYKKLKGNAIIKVFNYSLYESYRFHYTEPTFDGIFHQRKARNFTVANFRKRMGNTEVSFNQGASFSNAAYTYSTTDIDLSLYDLFSSFNIHHTGVVNEWKTGISYDHKASHFDGTFPVFNFATAQHHPVSQASSRNHVSNPEWYGYYKHYLGGRWIAAGGIRKNIAIEKLNDYFSVQGNLHYAPAEAFTVNLSAGRYHKYQLPQGESTSPFLIRSNQYSADISYTKPGVETSFSAYYKESFMDGTETQVKGLELFTRYRITRNLRFQVSLTSLDAMMYGDSTEKPSPYNIYYFVRGNIEYKIRGTWTITTVFLFRQGSYHYPVTSAAYNAPLQAYEPAYAVTPDRLPAYNTVDMNVSRIFMLTQKTTAIAFVSAGNISNRKNVRTYTYAFDYSTRQESLFSQRTFYCGLIINF